MTSSSRSNLFARIQTRTRSCACRRRRRVGRRCALAWLIVSRLDEADERRATGSDTDGNVCSTRLHQPMASNCQVRPKVYARDRGSRSKGMAQSDMDSAAARKGRVGLDAKTRWSHMTLAEEDRQADIITCPKGAM